MRKNRLRELLKAGQPSMGTHLHISWPAVVELVGHSGAFDYVEFEGLYAPYDLYALENLARAIDLFDHMTGMIKIDDQPRRYLAGRAIGSGIQNILFADVRSVADAEDCVRAVRAETPETGGLYGNEMRRHVGYVRECGSPAFVQALQDAVVVLMIEKKEAVENLDQILSVRGVDMIQFGPGDYSMGIGLTGQSDHPRVQEVERHVIESALRKGIQPRAELVSPDQAKRYLDMGVRHFTLGSDVYTLYEWYRQQGPILRTLIS